MDFRDEIIKLLVKGTKLKKDQIAELLTTPPDPKMGDYAFPCFKLGKNPKEAAEKLEDKLKKPEFIEKTQVVGPYLNFYLKTSALAQDILTRIQKEQHNFGKQNIGKGKTVVIEYSSPNIAKPFSIGHLRSTVIGNALNNIYTTLGYKTVSINHLGDWGTQFGKLIVAYNKWGDEKKLKADPIKYLLSIYVKFHDQAENDPSLEDDARAEFKALEEGKPAQTKLWKQFRTLSLQEFKKTYDALQVRFDSLNGEAFYGDQLESAIKTLQKKSKTKKSQGALIVDLENYGMPPMLLRKSDGASTYHTRDCAAFLYRVATYKPEKILYVVGSEQKLHFRQLFKALDLAGLYNNKAEHIDFGLFRFPEGKMSTRKGKVIFLEDVLGKAVDLAYKIIQEKNPKLKNKKDVAKIVGIGAIIFGDLSNDRTRNVNFDWDRMLSFEGETAPYIQYSHARACSILRKAQQKSSTKVDYGQFQAREEKLVLTQLYDYSDAIERVQETNKPHHLAHYLITLAQTFNEFYHKHHVISEDKKQMSARLLLVDSVRQVLNNGMGLLGIHVPQEM